MDNIVSVSYPLLTQGEPSSQNLFYRGNLDLLNLPKVAVVGSRRASQYTKQMIYSLYAYLLKEEEYV